MDTIICLVGERCSGKTTMARILQSKGYNVIQSFTTREKRDDNEWGHEFYPASYNIMEKWWNSKEERPDDIVAHQKLYGEHYWVCKQQYEGKGISIYTVDPKGVKHLQKNEKKAKIIVVYLKADKETRLDRLFKRCIPAHEISTTLEVDVELFKIIECDYVIDSNYSPKNTYENVNEVLSRLVENI